MNIILCGPPKTGKTTLGKKVADQLGWNFIDTDQEIKVRTGKSCREIYLEEGEQEFRRIESEVIASLQIKKPSIIAIGGGALIDEKNVAKLKSLGKLIYLKTSISELVNRVKRDRPAYIDANEPEQSFETLVKERVALYEKNADYEIKADDIDGIIRLVTEGVVSHGE